MLARAAPIFFVLIWSSGFVVARGAAPHAAPELFLLVRMALTTLLMGAIAVALRERAPRGKRLGLHLAAGALLNGGYLCTSWWVISRGLPAGVMALLGALQPLVVAVASFLLLRERLPGRGWTGLAVGFAGVVLVLTPLLGRGLGLHVPAFVIASAMLAVVAMAAGTMIQRGSLAQDGVCVSSAVQNVGGAAVALVATLALGDYRWDNSPVLWLTLAWSVLLLSAAALSLLVWMTRRQGATRVSVLLLLTPPLAAIEAWLLFGERLIWVQLIGFALALGGVLLARAPSQKTIREPA